MPNFLSIGLFCCPLAEKETQILPFLDHAILWCRQLAAISENRTRVHNYKSRPTPQRHQNRDFCSPSFHGEIVRTNSDVQKRDGQTDRQTKKLNVLSAPVAGEIRVPPNLAR